MKKKILTSLDSLKKTHDVLGRLVRGRANAKPLRDVAARLSVAHKLNITTRDVQTIIKPALLDLEIVIGPSKKGVFLCVDDQDYEQVVKWYDGRIAAEETNRAKVYQAWG